MNHTHDEVCDICREKIAFGNLGQATADTVLCSRCLDKAAEKALAAFEDLKARTQQFVRDEGLTFTTVETDQRDPLGGVDAQRFYEDLGGEG